MKRPSLTNATPHTIDIDDDRHIVIICSSCAVCGAAPAQDDDMCTDCAGILPRAWR